MSFDEIFDLTAGVYFHFIYLFICAYPLIFVLGNTCSEVQSSLMLQYNMHINILEQANRTPPIKNLTHML